MVFLTEEGDVICSSLEPVDQNSLGASGDFLFNEMRLVRGQIIHIYPIDDPNNSLGENPTFTLYDVQVIKPDGGTEIVRRCRMLQPCFGGAFNNFLEILSVDPGPLGRKAGIDMALKRGAHVLVGFVSGQKTAGIILGALPHPNSVAIKRRPLKSLGTYLEGEFQGFNFLIRNDGSFKITFNGPRNDKGEIIGTDGPTTLEFDEKGNIKVSTNAEQSVTIDRVKKTAEVINGTTRIFMEQDGSKITTESDFLQATVRQDARVDVGHQAKVIAKNDITVSSDTMIKLQRGEGANPAEPFVLGAVFVKFMSQFLQAVIAHTHTGNLGFPTLPPLNASEFAQLKATPIDDKKIQSKLIIGDN